MIQRILKITELEATAMRMQFLALFTNEFRSTVWTTRCNHMGTWEKVHNIDSKSKWRIYLRINSTELGPTDALSPTIAPLNNDNGIGTFNNINIIEEITLIIDTPIILDDAFDL